MTIHPPPLLTEVPPFAFVDRFVKGDTIRECEVSHMQMRGSQRVVNNIKWIIHDACMHACMIPFEPTQARDFPPKSPL